MTHPTPEDLAGARDPRVLAHIADCVECRAVLGFAARAATSPPIRLQSPAAHRRWWTAATAACLLAISAGMVVPLPSDAPPNRTFLHIDFEKQGGYILADGTIRTLEVGGHMFTLADGARTPSGWSAISVKLTEPIRIDRECMFRVQVATNAGYVIASLYPLGRDATFLRFERDTRDLSTLTGRIEPGMDYGTTLRPGDTIDWVTIAAPADPDTFMLVKAIELESLQ
ncbi:MAG TPA: hypothetical protein VI643_01465 [Planctomycetota bacterium]|nr:hypothetical protein [Planctomycetota bacterium]